MNTPELVIAVTDTVDAGGDVMETLAPTFKQMAEQRATMAVVPEGQPKPSIWGMVLANAGTLLMGALANHEKLIPEVKKTYHGCQAVVKAIKAPGSPESWDKKRNRPQRCDIQQPEEPAPQPPKQPVGEPPIPLPVDVEPTEPGKNGDSGTTQA